MELLCCESGEAAPRALPDSVLLQDPRVLANMLQQEDHYTPQNYFTATQKDIQPYMRKIVAEWMLEVCEEQRCEEEVLPLALNLVDRFLTRAPWRKEHLQLLATAAMLVSSKLKETVALATDKLVAYTDCSITQDQLFEMETLLLQVLCWDVSAVTSHDYLEQLVCRLPLDPSRAATVVKHAQTFCTVCYTDFRFTLLKPSLLAAGTVSAAVLGLCGEAWSREHDIPARLQSIVSTDAASLQHCQAEIDQILTNNFPNYVPHSTSTTPGSQPQDVPKTPNCKIPRSQASTPTDVRDVTC